MKEKLVSIIVPVYNVENYISKCIESILNQTYTDIELILVDDGSSDNSGVICDKYAHDDIRVKIFHKDNGGVSSARNYGIKYAQGEWLCFVDSDDFIDANYILDFLTTPASDLIMQGYVIERKGTILAKYYMESELDSDVSDIISESEDKQIINSPCFKLYKTEIVKRENIYFDKNTSYGEDHLFSLLYLRFVSSISVCHSLGYHYVLHEQESLSRRLIPLEMQIYYLLKARQYGLDILKSHYSDKLKRSYNRRLVINCKLLVKSIFYQEKDICLYSEYRVRCSQVLEDYKYGIDLKDRLFYYVFNNIQLNLSYYLLKSYFKFV